MSVNLKKGQVISQFRILEILPEGNGGMATVVKAANIYNAHNVALKISRSSEFSAFNVNALKAEVGVLQLFNHSGIVRIIPIQAEIGKRVYMERATEITGGPWFFVMEYLDGGSVGDLLKKIKFLSEEETGAIIYKMVSALDHVHSKGYAHNDIKANNVLFRKKLEVNSSYDPVLIDFGITRKKERVQKDAGSLYYMAPEQLREIRDERPPELVLDGTKVDVYSVGVLMYRMLVAQLPLIGVSEVGITTAIMTKTPTDPKKINAKISNQINDLIMSCLAKRPEARPTNQQIRSALKQYIDFPVTSKLSRGLFH